MDYIGNDVNYTVTETVFTAFYLILDMPSLHKRMKEAGFGRKTGRGFYDYSIELLEQEDRELGKKFEYCQCS